MFLISSLHAEETKPGGSFASGLVKGAGEGGSRPTPNGSSGDRMRTSNKKVDELRTMMVEPTKKKHIESGAPQSKGKH
jgi:hypothetical protein